MPPNPIDFNQLKQALEADIVSILYHIFPSGKLDKQEFVMGNIYGDPGKSSKYNTQTHLWADFAGEQSGRDVISLVAASYGISQTEAAKKLQEIVGVASVGAIPAKPKAKPNPWKALRSVPATAPPPPENHYKNNLNFVRRWAYYNLDMSLAGYVYRLDHKAPPGSGQEKQAKEFYPLSWCRHENGTEDWRWIGMATPRPLFGLETFSSHPANAEVIVVSGEKTAEAARLLFPGHVVVTWSGGDNAIKQTAWTAIEGRRVIIIPDADQSCRKTCAKLKEMLAPLCESAQLVDPPSGLPKGWDLADAIGWTPERAAEWVRANTAASVTHRDHPPGPQAESEHKPPESPGYKSLGYNGNIHYFLSRGHQVISKPASSLSRLSELLALAPLEWWMGHYKYSRAAGLTGAEIARANEDILSWSFAAGVFDPDLLRGSGLWIDNDRVILHAGDHLVVDGDKTNLTDIDSKFIYEASKKITTGKETLPDDEAAEFLGLCQSLSWDDKLSGALFAGWCVLAPCCGALDWRPHIWITSGAGGGKSWVLKNIVTPVLVGMSLDVQGATTVAGIRQTLGGCALPVVFDEAETPNPTAAAEMGKIIEFARQSSSRGGAKILKGSANGSAVSYTASTMMLFTSIAIKSLMQADVGRITTLTLNVDNSKSGKAKFSEKIKPVAKKLLTHKYCTELQARARDGILDIKHNATILADILSETLERQRLADQYGVLIAGAMSLHTKGRIDHVQAKEWVGKHIWNEHKHDQSESDEDQLLARILEHSIRCLEGKKTVDRQVGDLIMIATNRQDDEFLNRKMAHDTLLAFGIKVSSDLNSYAVANKSVAIDIVLRDTAWHGSQYGRTLQRLVNASPSPSVLNFGASRRSRATIIKISQS